MLPWIHLSIIVSLQINKLLYIYFVVELAACWNSAAGDLDHVQVARKAHPSCASFGHYLCGHAHAI